MGYTLTVAITSAFKRCNISGAVRTGTWGVLDAGASTDALLFDSHAINCTNVLGQALVGKTGYQLILDALADYQARPHAACCSLP